MLNYLVGLSCASRKRLRTGTTTRWRQETEEEDCETEEDQTYEKKVKMVTLKCYKVSDNKKIERLKRECPSGTCGAGSFMVARPDRFYLGKMCAYSRAGR